MIKHPCSKQFRRSQIIRFALASSAGIGGLLLKTSNAMAQSYQFTNAAGGSWNVGTNWAGGQAPASNSSNQILISADGTYNTSANVVSGNGAFNLNSLTVSLPTPGDLVTTTNDKLVFGNSAGNALPQLLLTGGSLSYRNSSVFAAGMNITNSGGQNLNFSAGTYTFSDNTTLTNSGGGAVNLVDGINYVSTGNVTVNLANTNGTFTIGNLGENISGTVNVSSGTVSFAGNATGGNLFGENEVLNVTQNATFDFNANPEAMGGISGSGNIINGGGITLDEPGNRTFNGVISGTGNVTHNGTGMLVLGGNNSFTGNLTVTNTGTLSVGGTNSYSGSTSVSGGGLLQLTSSTAVPPSSAVSLASGGLSLVGNSSSAVSETISNVTLGSSSTIGTTNQIAATSASGQTTTLTISGLTRTTGSTVDFNTTAAGGTAKIAYSTALTGGIIGGFATFNQSSWATLNGSGNVVPFTATVTSITAAGDIVLNTTKNTSTISINSLQLNNSAGVTFAANGSTMTITSGGILVPSAVSTATSIGAAPTAGSSPNGRLGGNTAGELFINVENSSTTPLTLNALINSTVSSALVKAGPGTLLLTSGNAYTGTTYINGGAIDAEANSSLGANAAPLSINGGTLIHLAGTLGAFTSTVHPTTIGPLGATFNFSDEVDFQGSGLKGSGNILKTGIGLWSVGTSTSAFTGNIIVSGGTLQETSDKLTSASNLTINSGGQFGIQDNGISNFNFTSGAIITLAGTGPATGVNAATPGALILTQQIVGGNTQTGPVSSIIDPVVLASDAAIGVYNNINVSSLVITSAITGAGNLTKLGSGLLTLTNAANAFGGTSGTTSLVSGTLMNGVANALPATTTLQFGQSGSTTAATYDLGGFNQSIAGLNINAGSGHQIINSSATPAVLNVNYNGAAADTFAGQIGGGTVGAPANNALALTKTGTGTLTLSAGNTYSGDTTIASGTLVLPTTGSISNSGNVVVQSGATLSLAASTSITPTGIVTQTLGNLNFSNGGLVTVAPTTLKQNRLLVSPNNISLAGTTGAWLGKVDLSNNDMDVRQGNLTLVTDQVKQGFNTAGTAGITSSSAVGDTTHLTTLGVIQNSTDGITPLYSNTSGSLGLFDGANPGASDVLVKYTYFGDANLDGKVDGSDYTLIDSAFTVGGATGWYNGDFNYDGVINGSDYTLIDNAFNTQGASFASESASPTAQVAGPSGSSAVPEPTTLSLIGLGAIGLLGRRRRI